MNIVYRIIAEVSKTSMSVIYRKSNGLKIRRPNVLISKCCCFLMYLRLIVEILWALARKG